MTPRYRPDIDGLRAIAVLSIVFFHLGLEGFDGGYVGVDIFFVISGYLITSIILREIQTGTFSIARFYERRVRRILPALTVTLIVTLLAGAVLLNPAQFEALGESAAATSVFLSNVYFFLGAGYFDGPSEHKPLLHTWSLAVEEQYYILFPALMLLIARRFAGRFTIWLTSIAVTSFIACVIWTSIDETAAFFLIQFRAWELLIGSLLALRILPVVESEPARNLLAATGLVMMLAAVYFLSKDTPFPSAAAALPTVGSALVIHAGLGGSSAVARLLSVRPMVFIGLISYSLYLVHWPLVVYAKQVLINEPTDMEIGVLFIAMLVLATLSWRFVERPFRNRQMLSPQPRLFVAAGAAVAVVLGGSVAIAAMQGFPGRDSGHALSDIVVDDPGWEYWKDCEELGEDDITKLCTLGETGVEPTFLFWGDSHALAMASALNLSAQRQGVAGLLAVRTGCPPLLDIERPGRSWCEEFNHAILERAASETDIDTVILAARWAISATGTRYKNEEGRDISLIDLRNPDADGVSNAELFDTGLTRTVAALEALGKTVVLVTQIPEVGFDVPSANYAARFTGRDVNLSIAPSLLEYGERNADVHATFARLAADHSLTIIDPAALFCAADVCNVVEDGMPLYRDDNHVSLLGCVRISGLFDDVLAQ